MKVINTEIEDDRGYFFESFNELNFINKVGLIDFVQDNERF